MGNDEEINLPSLGSSVLAERDDIERLLKRNVSSCWRGDEFDEERASHFLRDALKEIFDLQMMAYHGNTRYEPSWIPAIVGVSFTRVATALPNYAPSVGYYQRTSELLHDTIDEYLRDCLSADAIAAAFPNLAKKETPPVEALTAPLPPSVQQQMVDRPSARPNTHPLRTGSVYSPTAVERMEAYIEKSGIGYTDFASSAGTSDKTLRSFRNTKKVRRYVLDGIAKAMGTTREDLIKE
jgi:hypothetical protein